MRRPGAGDNGKMSCNGSSFSGWTTATGPRKEGMMPSACPGPYELRAFATGTLPGASFDLVAEHVGGCPSCEAALEAFDNMPDRLLTQLRETGQTPPPEGGFPDGLLQAVRSLTIRSIRSRISAQEP